MKIIVDTRIKHSTGELVCGVTTPKYNKPWKVLVSPATEDAEAVYRDETADEILERTIASLPDGVQNVTVIEHTELPYDGYRPDRNTRSVAMRNSWVNPPDTTSPPVVDMVKARQSKMDLEWRPRRNKLLAEMDVEYQRADEAADASKKAAIARDKAKLRDMPQDFAAVVDAITDPVDLDNFDPVSEIIRKEPV